MKELENMDSRLFCEGNMFPMDISSSALGSVVRALESKL